MCYAYKPLITKPTRINQNTASLIDHIWTNDIGNNTISSYILVTDITDHLPCFIIDNSDANNCNGYKYVTYRQITDKNRENFVTRVKQFEDALNLHTENTTTDTQTKYKDYFTQLDRIYEESFPVKNKKYTIKHYPNHG